MAATTQPTASMPVVLAPRPADRPPGPPAADLLAIVRTLPDVIFRCVKDEQGTIRWTMNEGRLAEEFHITTKDIYGKSLAEMFPPEVAARQLPHFEAAFRGEAMEWVHELGGRLFKHFPQPVRDEKGRVVAVVGFITDVTGLVQAQEQAKRLNGELLARLVELREANDHLAQANRDLDQFAATVSHDLRSPLTVIGTVAEVLRLRLEGHLDEDGRKQLGKIQAAVRRMDAMTSDLLAFARTAQQAPRAEDLDLAVLANDARQQLEAQDPLRQVDWQIAPDLAVRGDRGLLRAVLDNLLGNAWKYTARSHRPRISFRAEGKDPIGRPIFAVTDNGIGFAPGDGAKLFHPFQRLPGSEMFAGTGLGLATVRRIIERHGGTIWADSKPGHGATFRFTLANQAHA